MAQDIIEKLYPPTIDKSIPAFYEENGTAEITVPFSMNRAVGTSQLKGFSLKIKTIQSNQIIAVLETLEVEKSILNGAVNFSIKDEKILNSIKIGQYLKLQLAYVDLDDVIGYYSTVGIIKYTSKPKVYIQDVLDQKKTLLFRQTYTGVYEVTSDKTERPYSYCFSLYDNNQELVETSGWLLHNSELTESENTYIVDQAIDTYTFNSTLTQNEQYLLTYSVKTINNLTVTAGPYYCMEVYGGNNSLFVKLQAQNIFDEGYINLSFKKKESTYFNEDFFKPVTIKISRSESADNYLQWKTIKRVYFNKYADILNWSIKDFTIEQGVSYKYAFQQYNEMGFSSERDISDIVYADFEDTFLYDGERQLKIRFNPKINSFKTTQLEQKIDTIGSKFPFFFRNTVVGYKEFPISGLISYLMDDNQLFINHLDNLNINYDAENMIRDNFEETHYKTTNLLDYNIYAERRFKLEILDWLNNGKIKMFKSPTEGNYIIRLMNISLSPEVVVNRMLHNFSATAYEVAEYTHQNLINLKLINIDEPESIKTSIMSVSLREKYLLDLGSFSEDDKLTIDQLRIIQNPLKINNGNILNFLKIELITSNFNKPYYVFRLKEKNGAIVKKFIVQNGSNLNLTVEGTYEDLYFNLEDNFDIKEIKTKEDLIFYLDFLEGIIISYGYEYKTILTGDLNSINQIYVDNKCYSLFGPGEMSFSSIEKNNKNILIKQEEFIRFFSLQVFKKDIINLYSPNFNFEKNIRIKNISNYYEDKELLQQIVFLSPIYLYNIIDPNTNKECLYFYKEDSASENKNKKVGFFIKIDEEIIDKASESYLTPQERNAKNNYIEIKSNLDENQKEIKTFYEPQMLDLTDIIQNCSGINLGNGVYAYVSYQNKVTTYKEVTD